MRRPVAVVFLVIAVTASGAHAVVASGEKPPSAASVREAAPSASATAAAALSSLNEGVVTDVSAEGDRVQIQGTWLKVVPDQTRIFLRGSSITAKQLQKNSKVKFTLSADRSTLGVVYAP